MLDPATLFQTLQEAAKLGQTSQSKLQSPFLQGVSNIDMSSVNSVDGIIKQVMSANSTMLNNMNTIFHGVQDNVSSYQKQQSQEKPQDFEQSFDDLRPSNSFGVPFELREFFDTLPKLK